MLNSQLTKTLELSFVALSRLFNYKDFIIQPFCCDRLHKISQSTCLQPRLEEENRIKIMNETTVSQYSYLITHLD